MTHPLSTMIFAVVLGSGYALAEASPAMSSATALSAATKKSSAKRRQETGQIACTVSGCHRIPSNCRPETGYNWDGIPTGFDIVVCRYPRGRRG